jgi:tRNA U34 5-carboxymethylaminomethyl modifying enzyme MnmG/GidA
MDSYTAQDTLNNLNDMLKESYELVQTHKYDLTQINDTLGDQESRLEVLETLVLNYHQTTQELELLKQENADLRKKIAEQDALISIENFMAEMHERWPNRYQNNADTSEAAFFWAKVISLSEDASRDLTRHDPMHAEAVLRIDAQDNTQTTRASLGKYPREAVHRHALCDARGKWKPEVEAWAALVASGEETD